MPTATAPKNGAHLNGTTASNIISTEVLPLPAGPAGKEKSVTLPSLRVGRINIRIIGTTPLVTNNWSNKAKEQMRASQQQLAKQGRAPKVPVEDFTGGLYIIPGTESEVIIHDQDPNNVYATGRFGVKGNGVKQALIRAGTDVGLKMSDLRRQLQVRQEFVEIECDPGPFLREDLVRVGMGTADLRYRPEFREWSCIVPIHYNANMTNPEKIINLVRTAGFGVGLGEWRMEKGGDWGSFEVDPSGIEVLSDISC